MSDTGLIPHDIIVKLVNRSRRYYRLQNLPVTPKSILEGELDLILRALNDLDTVVVEHGIHPSEAEFDKMSEQFKEEAARLIPTIKMFYPDITDHCLLETIAASAALHLSRLSLIDAVEAAHTEILEYWGDEDAQ